MTRRDLARLVQRNEIAGTRVFATIDPRSVRRLGLGAATIAGVFCVRCRETPFPQFHRAIGFGIRTGSAADLDRIERHYERHGLPVRVEVAEGLTPSVAIRFLERRGFAPEADAHHVHVLETDRAPIAPDVSGLRIEPVTARRAREFGRLIRSGFGVEGAVGDLFERASVAHARTYPPSRAVSLIARVDGRAAGTAMLWLTPGVAGLYSGSVLEQFRGRGIQSALIAERVRLGLRRARRVFTSQTAGDDASAHNLHDMGFRLLYRAIFYVRRER